MLGVDRHHIRLGLHVTLWKVIRGIDGRSAARKRLKTPYILLLVLFRAFLFLKFFQF